ncbi:DVU_1557 family redox protein [Sporomusa sp. KB1]|jgi:predicted RNA-binding Zn-ribbon protein involved in translation (DUF1610 family)|uniref:DVU_1557 family redox protein n=1 Tax=Sporomusa sp. KB1 TaxID=943346 RepID=UPI0011AE023D|nr:CLJU_RS11820 family redox protein [Sporomusa sp. KB1]TWH48731.1 hypothetical protein Salpa_4901 [Sporomusa sp. KB1]
MIKQEQKEMLGNGKDVIGAKCDISLKDEMLGNGEDVICTKCNIPLKVGYVTLAYVGATFPVELFKCPECGMVYIPSGLARGTMLQVERALEDK